MKKNIIATLILALILVMAVSAENIGFTYYMSEAMGGMCISGGESEKVSDDEKSDAGRCGEFSAYHTAERVEVGEGGNVSRYYSPAGTCQYF